MHDLLAPAEVNRQAGIISILQSLEKNTKLMNFVRNPVTSPIQDSLTGGFPLRTATAIDRGLILIGEKDKTPSLSEPVEYIVLTKDGIRYIKTRIGINRIGDTDYYVADIYSFPLNKFEELNLFNKRKILGKVTVKEMQDLIPRLEQRIVSW